MTSRETFVELVGGVARARECEERALSVGREFLPVLAIRVRDDLVHPDEDLSGYWRWLSGQWVDAQEVV